MQARIQRNRFAHHRSGQTSRLVQLVGVLVLGVLAGTSTAAASLDRQVTFSIPAQPLDQALLEFSRQANVQLAIAAGSLERIQAPDLSGKWAVTVALSRLLRQTGLAYHTVGDTVTVTPASDTPRVADERSVRLANAASRTSASTSDAISGPTESSYDVDKRQDGNEIAQVLVTAQKREERLQDVPVPVTAISADTLVEQNQLRLQDYYTSIPGFSVSTGSFHALSLDIRGLTTGGGNPTVGIVLDDIPYGPSKGVAFGNEAPDIDPSDLARVEVLRGPQGTLYGASSLGGLLKFVTVDPSTDAVSGRLQASTFGIQNGDGLGYSVRGSVNVPLSDTAAIRVSGFSRIDPGYIDNPFLGGEGVNRINSDGGHASFIWRPSDDFSMKLSALLQHRFMHGTSEVDVQPGLTDLQQIAVAGTGSYDKNIQAYSATLTGKLANIEVTSLTGYNLSKASDSVDLTPIFDPTLATGFPILDNFRTSKFSQELRLASTVGRLDWLLGGFYTHEKTDPATQDILATDPLTGTQLAVVAYSNGPSTFTEYAAFLDLTVHITGQFNIQFGGRESQNEQSYTSINLDPVVEASPSVNTKDNAFTYLVTPQFKISPDLMVYARFASGYRPGGPNTNVATFGLPTQYGPDKTQNYEIGVKGDLLDHKLSFDASAYYIDWKKIQIQLVESGLSYYANGSEAKSQGLEFSVQSRPLTGLEVSAWVSWTDAVLTESLPATSSVVGSDGDRLPLSSRFSGSLSLEQTFPLVGRWLGVVGGSASYVGARIGNFEPTTVRQVLPSYTKADLRASVRDDSWNFNLFVDNVADRRGVLEGGLDNVNTAGYYYIQPRTIGLSVSTSF